jgi:hypothetical protein
MLIAIIKAICIFVSIWFTQVNIIRAYAKIDIPSINFVLQSFSVALFIFLQWLI